jgi:hypothetical protein
MDEKTEKRVAAIEALARLWDSQFSLPGIPVNLGLDTIIGFIPVIGDTLSLGVSSYIVSESARLGVGKGVVSKMVFNIFIDWFIGLIPLIGDLFDWGWKANNRNAALLRQTLEHKFPPEMKNVTPEKYSSDNQIRHLD